MQRLYALRGAVSVERNDADSILGATDRLVREMMARNALTPADLVSCIFTVTDDLDAEFPAVAARALGLDAVPLLCAREVPVPGALPRVIRAMVHYYAPEGHEARHVYLGDARVLRRDLHSAQ
jgi:chorismate mutase